MLQTFLSPEFRRVRIATLAIVALTVLPLPLGFVEVAVAEALGIYGLYLTLPMVCIVLLGVLAVESRWSRRVLRALAVSLLSLTGLYILYFALWTGPFILLAIPPVAVVVMTCRRLIAAASLRD